MQSVEREVPAARVDVHKQRLVEGVAGSRFAGHINLVANLIRQQVVVTRHFVGFSLVIDELIAGLRPLQASSEIVARRGRSVIR